MMPLSDQTWQGFLWTLGVDTGVLALGEGTHCVGLLPSHNIQNMSGSRVVDLDGDNAPLLSILVLLCMELRPELDSIQTLILKL